MVVELKRLLRENDLFLFHDVVGRLLMNILSSISRVFAGTRIRCVLFALLGFGLMLSIVRAEEIGTVASAKVGAFAEREGESRPLKTGDKIDSADVLKTDATGSLSLKLKDGAVISLGAKSRLAADEIELSEEQPAAKAPPPSAKVATKPPSWSRGAETEEASGRGAFKKNQGSKK